MNDSPCVICGKTYVKQEMAVGELTVGDVNMELGDDGPVCSRKCMRVLPRDVYPYATYAIDPRFYAWTER